MNKPPPEYPFRLLKRFCKHEYLEEIEGDLHELYNKRVANNQPARVLLWLDILILIRPRLLRLFNNPNKIPTNMLPQHVKVSIRSFSRHRTAFLINYIGLVGGLLTVLFIYLWVNHELRVDRFHTKGDNLFRLVSGNGSTKTILNTNSYFAEELEASIPEIDYVVNSCWGPLYSWLATKDHSFATKGEYGSKRFFELFSYPLLVGNAVSVLEDPNAIVLSESMARKLFNSTDIIGKRLEWRWFSHQELVVVSGVFKDLPKSSSEQFDYVLNFEVYERRSAQMLRRTRSARTYVKLKNGASPHVVDRKIRDYTRATYPEYSGSPYFLVGFADFYLENIYEDGHVVGGRIELVRLFMIIGGLILLIACINFMNLSTSRASMRMKEIGVRKTLGAQRKSLIWQFLTESCLISLFSGLTATGLLFILLPSFQQLLDQPIQVSFNPLFVLGFIGIIIFTGLLAGSYPAFYLAGFNPLKVPKGNITSSSNDQWLRKGLVVFQFSTSLILMIGVIVVYQQMQFVQNKSLGYQNKYIINFRTTGMNGSKQKAFLDEVRALPGVIKAAGISHALFGIQRSGANMTWTGKDPNEEVWFEYGHLGFDMLELLEIDLVEGRSFSREFGDETRKIVINQTAKELMGVESAVGEKFTVGETNYEIIGVTEDFHFESLHEEIKPTFFLLNLNDWYMKLALKVEPDQIQSTLSNVETVYSRFNPDFPFQYSFHDLDQHEMYDREIKVHHLTKYAAGLAILISMLGLFGLVSFVTERKAKEMGIRKILGASTSKLIKVLSADFFLPFILSVALGVAVALVTINQCLNEFAYHIELKWWFFAGASLLMLFMAIITSTLKVLKTITANPIDSLRDE